MRILFICNEFPPTIHGGIGTFVFTLAHKLTELGHEIHVIGFDRNVKQTVKSNEGGVFVCRLHPTFYANHLFKVGRYDILDGIIERVYLSNKVLSYCRNNKIDIVESYDWSGPLWSHPGKPLLVRMHGAHSANAFSEGRRSSRFLSYIEKRNLGMADYLVGVSQHISVVTLRAAGLSDRVYSVIYNGVDTTLFRPLEVEKNENEVLFAGTVARRKGIYELFDAIPLVFEAVPEAKFTMLGRLPSDESDRKAMIGELLQKIPVEKRDCVKFAGARPYSEMPEWYNRATCSVFPSLAEAFGLTCAEAMACGTPVVMTSRASGPELVEDGVTGLLVDPDNKYGLVDAIVHYLSDPGMRRTISQNSIEAIQKKFDINKVILDNVSIYEQMIAGDHE